LALLFFRLPPLLVLRLSFVVSPLLFGLSALLFLSLPLSTATLLLGLPSLLLRLIVLAFPRSLILILPLSPPVARLLISASLGAGEAAYAEKTEQNENRGRRGAT